MERNYYDDEFEDFLKQKADQYNLYPSDKVWHGIYNSLHSGRKWYTAAGALLLITTMIFISLEIVSSGYQKVARNIVNDTISSSRSVTSSSIKTKSALNTANPVTKKIIASVAVNKDRESASNGTRPGNNSENIPPVNTSVFYSTEPASYELKRNASPLASRGLLSVEGGSSPIFMAPQLTVNGKDKQEEKQMKEHEINWLQEMATIRLLPNSMKRYHLQFYISPGASYRRLNNFRNNSKASTVSPVSGDPVNIDGIVDHQPAFGLEAGAALLFNVSDHFILKGGLQVNYVRYNIKAYKAARERTAITLSSANYSNAHDTITSYSSIRNLGGRYPQELQNQYFQLSLPIGAEVKVLGNKRFQFNIAGTVQPTYLLYNNTYLLTSDFGNYTKQPDLVRKWNVNAAVETYISYSTPGGIRWQLGPQFRYQLLSTYTDRYPVREYLMEYGIKIGISKTLR